MSTAAAPAPALSLVKDVNDVLEPIAAGLWRLTSQCWDRVFVRDKESPDEKLVQWYLKTDGFHRHPELALKCLYADNHLDAGLVYLKVHESIALADDVERRLREPLRKLCALSFRANQILNGDWEGESKETFWHPYNIDEVNRSWDRSCQDSPGRKAMEEVVDGWCEIRNSLREAAQYLNQLTWSLKAKTRADSEGEKPVDLTAFVSASTLVDTRFTGLKQIKTALKNHPWIRSRKPSKQRLEIHAGDWHKLLQTLDATAFDGLDANPTAIDDFLEEAKQRKEVIRQSKTEK